ncbi:hypothetical protein FisN_6Hu125 [Fistulifera solaris]|uniref:Uncharacterized protein n=1 Tax=Fistulifera solaris TaxID=1519565 RepID=A0A1Z5KHY9_FISSO|nr:hypothetical protein FisN_6Hu125 [Fistulifera solaris]|eukprot:GAX25837.1 hypothetical protein FisN_6Hu125 [Fistulifera solaris]
MNKEKKDDLLELIPQEQLSVEQQAFQQVNPNYNVPVYRFLREPRRIDDFDNKDYHHIALWRENGTMVCMDRTRALYLDKHVHFEVGVGSFSRCFTIYGKTDAAIAETATFFWSLKQSETSDTGLSVYSTKEDTDEIGSGKQCRFDFAALQPEQLASVLNSNPTRCFDLHTGNWGIEQSIVLANRPYPLKLNFSYSEKADDFDFVDRGTAFVDTLGKRQALFGSLCISAEIDDDKDDYNYENYVNTDKMPISRSNLHRLLELSDVFDKLTIRPFDNGTVLFPFSARVKSLEYQVDVKYINPRDFSSVDIVTKGLKLTILLDGSFNWNYPIAALNCIAKVGHFERLTISITDYECRMPEYDGSELMEFESTVPVAEALVGVIKGNPNLTYLDVSNTLPSLNWGPNLKGCFEAMEEHKSLRTFIVDAWDWANLSEDEYSDSESSEGNSDDDEKKTRCPHYSWLERLLSCNRSIIVLNSVGGRRYSNGSSISKLYEENFFYHGSANLLNEPPTLRLSLVATTLAESASERFRPCALVLLNHTDILCELVQNLNLDMLDAPQSVSEVDDLKDAVSVASTSSSCSQTGSSSKRRASTEPSRAAHKAARHDS